MQARHVLILVALILAGLAAVDVARQRALPLRARIWLVVAGILLAVAALTR